MDREQLNQLKRVEQVLSEIDRDISRLEERMAKIEALGCDLAAHRKRLENLRVSEREYNIYRRHILNWPAPWQPSSDDAKNPEA